MHRAKGQIYYWEIDGIRALAVVLVILFHLQIPGFSGGFVGVDVFFVISGYLITTIIYEEFARNGKFKYGSFFLRRFKRIFPALAFTAFVSFWVAGALFSPYDFKMFCGSLVAAITGTSNVFFWTKSGYFDGSAYVKPLLHTWSLSVEAQFYCFWPMIIVFLQRKAQGLVPAIVLTIGIVSLVLNILFVWDPFYLASFFGEAVSSGFKNREATIFFLIPFRVFEFSIGASLIWVERFRHQLGWVNEILALVGLAMVLWCGILFSKRLAYPSYYALMPCVGTALMILSANSSRIAGACLRFNAVRIIGLMSYSLYLVHWPMIVFYKYEVPSWSNADKLFVVVATFVVSIGMYMYIEGPFRNISTARLLSYGARFWTALVLAIFVFSALPTHAYLTNGWRWRFPTKVANLIAATSAAQKDIRVRATGCSFTNFKDFDKRDCVHPERGKINILLLGDSVAERIWIGLAENLPTDKYAVLQMSPSNCRPGINWGNGYCLQSNRFVFKYIKSHKIDLTIFASLGPDYNNFRKTLEYMNEIKKPALVVGMPFIFKGKLPDIIAQARPTPVTDSEVNAIARNGLIDDMIAARRGLEGIARSENVPYFDIEAQLCRIRDDLSTCNFTIDGGLITADNNHLTPVAAKKIFLPLSERIRSWSLRGAGKPNSIAE